ncbi:MAG: ammonium transporter [Fibrobacteria bacterium]|nr:ammonium transporter [Fibrobacteria bacterium]
MKKKTILRNTVILFILLFSPLFAEGTINTGDSAWMMVSTGLVLFMVPGLALFYGGMVRSKNILGTLMHSIIALGVMTIQWVVIGYSLAFGEGNAFIGDFSHIFLRGFGPESVTGTIPSYVWIAFQGTFACITPALIAGAFAERVKFGTYVIFILIWGTLVYDPVCHWVWAEAGWLFKDGAIDFAGGTVVHIISGIAGLVTCIVIGKRRGYPSYPILPHNLVYTVLGAGILWFGWFGFNAGSALAANTSAGLAFINTFISPAAGMIGWLIAEKIHLGKPSALGAASGIVAGLVAITPAAGSVLPGSAIILGLITAICCYVFVALKKKFGYDDSLDAFGVHGIGGTIGAIGCGIFASVGYNSLLFPHSVADGNSGIAQFIIQIKGVAATGMYSIVVTLIIVFALDKTLGFRAKEEDELQGLDITMHGETAYNSEG